MGTRTTDTMNEIEIIRQRLDGTLRQLEGRMPPVAQIGRRVLAISGGTIGGGVALAVAKRFLRRKPAKAVAGTTPVVTVKSGISLPAAVAVAAIWAGVRIFEARQRSATQPAEGGANISLLPGRRRVQ